MIENTAGQLIERWRGEAASRQSRSKALFADGRNLYAEYLRAGGTATLKPRADIITTMARRLDLTQTYIREALSAYLWDL